MEPEARPVVFTPANEPYLGRPLLFHLDQLIISAMEQNAVTAPMSHDRVLTDHQEMACLVIAQALSITLSMRELIRQGYLCQRDPVACSDPRNDGGLLSC